MGALVPAISLFVICVNQSWALIDAQTSKNTDLKDHYLITQFQNDNLRIARLESILDDIIQDLNAKTLHLKEREKLIKGMTHEIDRLQSTMFSFKDDKRQTDKRLKMLEEEVRLLWAASRKNNFELHTLKSKAQDADKKMEVVTSKAEKMADIVTEQWIQIQQLEQALQIVETRTLKIRRQISSKRCTFLKFIKTLFDYHYKRLMVLLDPYIFNKGSALNSYLSQAWHQLKRTFSAVKQSHHQLQSLIKQEMERNEITAAFANEEVVFFVASALITFPILSVWMILLSQFS